MADTKQCEQCGQAFAKPGFVSRRAWPKRRYCSAECAKAARRAPDIVCPICDKSVRRPYAGQRTCRSESCKAEYRRTIGGRAISARLLREYAAGTRKRRDGLSPRELVLKPLLIPSGWVWRLRWGDLERTWELDFAHIDRKLDVEIDGVEHREPRGLAKDEARDAELRARGWRILRISNEDVDADAEAVAERVLRWAALGDNQRDACR